MNKLILILLIIMLGLGLFWWKNNSNKNQLPYQANSTETAAVSGTPLVTKNGIPVITVESLADEEAKIFESNPQLKAMSMYMDPQEFKQSLLAGLTNQIVIDEFVRTSNINQTDAYQADIKEGYKAVERMVNTKYFSEKFNVQVSDQEIMSFYNDNKNVIPNLIISRGGTKTTTVDFATEADAQAFANAVKAQTNDIAAVARNLNVPQEAIKDLKLVHEQSMAVEPLIKEAILKANVFPFITTIKIADNKFVVVIATAKEEAKYRPLEQVKNDLKSHLEKEKRSEVIEKEIEILKKEYGIVTKEDAFVKETEAEQPFAEQDQIEEDQTAPTPQFSA